MVLIAEIIKTAATVRPAKTAQFGRVDPSWPWLAMIRMVSPTPVLQPIAIVQPVIAKSATNRTTVELRKGNTAKDVGKQR